MRLRYLAGDRTGALRQFERCAAALDSELDVLPSRATVHLYEQIRGDRLPAANAAPPPISGKEWDQPFATADLRNYFKQLGAFLEDLHRQVQLDLDQLEMARAVVADGSAANAPPRR
jgi:hypothetical protein